MAHVRLVNKQDEIVKENDKFRLEITGQLALPRVIEENGVLYRYDRKEGSVTIYKQSDI